MSAIDDLANLQRPDEFTENRPDLVSAEGMKWLIRNRDRNGLTSSGAVLKVRNRMLLHKERFAQWILSQTA